MNKTDIEWCGSTWNPITGCLHGCKYCYARGITRRFGGSDWEVRGYESECYDCGSTTATGEIHELYEPLERVTKKGDIVKAAYPFYFDPTFHHYRLNEPKKDKKPQNIFVGSMADMFGNWVPDGWIKAVFEACKAAPWHKYLFLTKNPKGYDKLSYILEESLDCENYWLGFSATNRDDFEERATEHEFYVSAKSHSFVSLEPLHGSITLDGVGQYGIEWVIIGAETGSRKYKVTPKCGWIESVVSQCRESNVPVFMKSSIAGVWREPLIQEYPKGLL